MIARSSSLAWFFCLLLAGRAHAESPKVQLQRTPGGGIQPQAVVDSEGVLHLIYFNPNSEAGKRVALRQGLWA